MKLISFILGMGFAASSFAGQDLIGTWDTNCRERGENGYISSATFNKADDKGDTSFSWKFLTYVAKDCEEIAVTRENPGTYKLGDVSGAGNTLDLVLTAYNLTAHVQGEVDKLNEKKYCGFADWELNKPKKIGGLECDGKIVHGKGETYYDLVKIEAKDEGTSAVFGKWTKENDGSTSEKRPNELDMEAVYVQKK